MMNVNEIFNAVRNFDFNAAVMEMGRDSHVLTQAETTALAATAVIGILLCFFGWKVVRLWAALSGLVLGTAAGAAVAVLAGMNGSGILLIGLAAGIVLAVLGAVLYRMGVFLLVFISVSSFCIGVINPQDWLFTGICLAAGLVAAILSVRFVSVLTILVTTVYGAAAAGTAIYHLLPITAEIIRIILCIIIAALGLTVQLLLESKRQKKKSLKKAAEIREERSTANEVERARAMMDNLEREPEEDPEEEDGKDSPEDLEETDKN